MLNRISVFLSKKMCKFNQFLVLFVCCAQFIQISVTSPLGTLLFDDYLDEQADDDYDLHYDERQNGTENYRLNINGVVIAVPGASSNAMSSVGLLASNYLLELAEAAAAANEESNSDHGADDVSTDDHPYDFEVPSGSEENNDDKTEVPEPVVIISADSITKPLTKPVENESAVHDLKPENNVDAVAEKESSTNKKDLNVEIAKVTDTLKLTKDKTISEVIEKDKEIAKETDTPKLTKDKTFSEVIEKDKESAKSGIRQVPSKVPLKRRNKYFFNS